MVWKEQLLWPRFVFTLFGTLCSDIACESLAGEVASMLDAGLWALGVGKLSRVAGNNPVCTYIEAELTFWGRCVPHRLDRFPSGSPVVMNSGATMWSGFAEWRLTLNQEGYRQDLSCTFFISLFYFLRTEMKKTWFNIHKLNMELPLSEWKSWNKSCLARGTSIWIKGQRKFCLGVFGKACVDEFPSDLMLYSVNMVRHCWLCKEGELNPRNLF